MISKIVIQNFKSIEKMTFDIDTKTNILCLLGKNGVGKSNVFKAISFYFNHLNKTFSEEIVVDKINPYTQKCVIAITFNIHLLRIKAHYNQKLESAFEEITRYLDDNGIDNDYLELIMTQYKNGSIIWNIKNDKIRNTIRSTFPLYHIDTRHLDLFSWDKIWKIINDLSITMPQIDQQRYTKILDTAFEEIYGQKFIDSKDILQMVFEENAITMDKYHYESKLTNAFSMRFGGNQFMINDRDLSFYSDGTNSVKYLTLLISLIPKITVTSCKFPILIIDEPEIGLHNAYICDFISCVSKNIKHDALLFMSTHSPKIISELANSDVAYSLYKIDNKRLYSNLKKMNISWLNSNAIVSIKETECYFSDYLVYVEGETELQIFNNIHIRSLFPKLSKIHFYSFDSNNSRFKNAYSNSLNLGIEYKIILDIDKIVQYNNTKFKLASDKFINPININQQSHLDEFRYYKPHHINLSELRERINLLLKKTYIPFNNMHYFNDSNFTNLMHSIKNYCNHYNIIVNHTTIEGELITVENIDKFLLFLQTLCLTNQQKGYLNTVLSETDPKEKTIHIIFDCNGKTETQDKFSVHQKLVGSKTGGWVSDWLDYYFENYINPISDPNIKAEQFKSDFPSFFTTLQILSNMVK